MATWGMRRAGAQLCAHTCVLLRVCACVALICLRMDGACEMPAMRFESQGCVALLACLMENQIAITPMA